MQRESFLMKWSRSNALQESMSSTDQPSTRLSCTFCTDDCHSPDTKKLESLLMDIDRLSGEKSDLLRQNVSCKTDIKKLKERQSCLADELDRANEEIARLRRLVKQPSHHTAGLNQLPSTRERSFSDVSV
uniref:Uncharacterized protein n=1 Tax=Angiostrongylus cantonensis TaxID=6313 RepID=A0A0K0DF93_ANGCA